MRIGGLRWRRPTFFNSATNNILGMGYSSFSNNSTVSLLNSKVFYNHSNWFRLTYDGDDEIKGYISIDGEAWVEVFEGTKSNVFTGAIAYAGIQLYTTGVKSGTNLRGFVDHFAITYP